MKSLIFLLAFLGFISLYVCDQIVMGNVSSPNFPVPLGNWFGLHGRDYLFEVDLGYITADIGGAGNINEANLDFNYYLNYFIKVWHDVDSDGYYDYTTSYQLYGEDRVCGSGNYMWTTAKCKNYDGDHVMATKRAGAECEFPRIKFIYEEDTGAWRIKVKNTDGRTSSINAVAMPGPHPGDPTSWSLKQYDEPILDIGYLPHQVSDSSVGCD